MQTLDSEHHVYVNEDGRMRVYDKITQKVTSFPRYIMETHLGKPLKQEEDVHHKDGNPLNNNIENLEIIIHGEHQRQHNPQKYFDKEMICPNCGKSFVWTAKQQLRWNSNKIRRINMQGPFCSKSCAAKYTYVKH